MINNAQQEVFSHSHIGFAYCHWAFFYRYVPAGISGYCKKPAHICSACNAVAVQFLYWYFCGSISVWAAAGKVWQKKADVLWPFYIRCCFYRLCYGYFSKFINYIRGLQALGGCAGMVAARAIVRDLFEVKENAKIFSMLMLVVAVSPIVAPTAGGYITSLFGWRYVFIILIGIDLIIIAGVYFLLPESKKPDPDFSLKAGAITKNFWGIASILSFILIH